MKKVISMFLSLLVFFSMFSFVNQANASEIESNENTIIAKENEILIQPFKGSGDDSFELGFLIANGLFNEPTNAWHRGSFDFPGESIVFHYNKHGKDVGAKSAASYLNKSIQWRKTAKKGAKVKSVPEEVPGVKRYSKNGRYIDLAPGDKIISFGTTN